MNHLLAATAIVAIFGLHAHGQDAYINGHQWYGHEVDLSYIDYEKIRAQGDPKGAFGYANRHLRTMTQFTYGDPVFVMQTKIMPPDDVNLVLVRRAGESATYWTDLSALSTVDPFATEKLDVQSAQSRAAQQKGAKAQELFERELQRKASARAAEEDPFTRRPITIERYWQIGKERFRGKLVNANDTHVKILKSSGETIVVDRRHLSETSDSYVSGMLQDLDKFRKHQGTMTKSS